jgi:hypothetical protein
MRILAFLLIGTLLFGLAFPAAILFVALLVFIIFAVGIFALVRGGSFTVYRGGREQPPYDRRGQTGSGHGSERNQQPPVMHPEEIDVIEFGEDAEGEIVELPASALRKDDDES